MQIRRRLVPAKPRSKELYFEKGVGGGGGSGGAGSITNITPENLKTYWELVDVDEGGNPLSVPFITTQYPIITNSEDGKNYIQIGDAQLVYDEINKALQVIKEDGSSLNFYASGEVSAFGIGDTEGGGGGGNTTLSSLNDVSFINLSVNDILQYNGTHWVNIPIDSYKPDLEDYATKEYVDSKLENLDADKHYQTSINVPSKAWSIEHQLNKYPAVTVINNDNREVIGDIEYIDLNNIKITFSAEFSGKIICN